MLKKLIEEALLSSNPWEGFRTAAKAVHWNISPEDNRKLKLAMEEDARISVRPGYGGRWRNIPATAY